ncbi:hypothetical protein K438DRAFT_1199660 [Mycena galopus ATCC 62051]|nr:hypothetical protein K438DRAFT_1199660 [Mycena galopus ATCC 62051]
MARLQTRSSAPATLLPSSNDAFPAAPSVSPRIRPWRAQATIRPGSVKYTRCVQRAGRVRDAHHVLPTSTAAFSSTRRARPSQPCDPSPRHAQGPVPFLRASGSSVIASFTPPHVTHDPRTSPRLPNGDSTPIHAIVCLRNVFTYCCHSAQSPLSAVLDGNPQGIPHRNCPHSESHYQLSMSHAPPSLI